MLTQDTEFYLRMHKHYTNNLLLVAGGIIDQPNKYLEAMEILG